MPQAGISIEDMIRQEAERAGIPVPLALGIAEGESSFNPGAVGPEIPSMPGVRAVGVYQFLPGTAAKYNIDPRDPEQNIQGAMRYLGDLLKQHKGDEDEVLRSFGGVVRDTTYVPAMRKRIAKYEAMNVAAPPPKPATRFGDVQQQLDEMKARMAGTAPPDPGPSITGQRFKDFVGEAVKGAESLTPTAIGNLVEHVYKDPVGSVTGAVSAIWNPKPYIEEGRQLAAEGRPGAGVLRGWLGMWPGIGPRLVESEKFAREGEGAKSLGALTDVAASVAVPEILGSKARRIVPRAFPPSLNPKQAAAVALGTAEGLPVDAALASGSPFALKLQRSVEATARGARVAQDVAERRATEMPALGQRIADKVHPAPVTPKVAGEGLLQSTNSFIARRGGEADTAYDTVRRIAADPQHTQQVRIGMSNGYDQFGNVVPVPIMGPMQLPVDFTAVKAVLRPIRDRIKSRMNITQQAASDGLKALDNLVDGPDFVPAVDADIDLGTLKTLARTNGDVRDIGQGLAAKAVSEVSDAVDAAFARAGPQAQQALAEGRAATLAKHAGAEIRKKLQGEAAGKRREASGVAAWRQTQQPSDVALPLLQELQKMAPHEMARVGRATLEDIFSIGAAEGGWDMAGTMLGRWNRLGAETKKILFGSQVDTLDQFFLLGKMMAKTPNASGTALTLTATGSLWEAIVHPSTGLPALVGAGSLAKLMNTPGGVEFLTEGYQIPAGTARAAAWGVNLTRLLSEQAKEDEEATGAAPPAVVPRPPAPQR
jgi:hypothetical protein